MGGWPVGKRTEAYFFFFFDAEGEGVSVEAEVVALGVEFADPGGRQIRPETATPLGRVGVRVVLVPIRMSTT